MFLWSFSKQILCLANFFPEYQAFLHRDWQSASLVHVKLKSVITENSSELKKRQEDLKDIF